MISCITTSYQYVETSDQYCTLYTGHLPERATSGNGKYFTQYKAVKVIHLNIRSLRNNVRELIQMENFDIVTNSETWLNKSVLSAEASVKIGGYNFF